VYRADVVARLDLDTVRADGYGFQIEMADRVRKLGERVVEHPISFRDRERGTSKMSGAIVVEALWMVTWWGLRDRVLRRLPGVKRLL
jgi:dolichol-phosphate mannosyltransferase